MSGVSVSVRNLTKVYGKRPVVHGVSFSVRESEIFGLLGPNGAGKTAIINILTGLIRPTEGEVEILGRELSRSPIEIKRHIGHVYANMAFYPHLSALENLEFFGRFYRLTRSELRSRIEDRLRFVDLWDERKKKAGAYSQGMKQRLGIAKALLHDPQILFLDEATSGIDVQGVNLIRGYVYELRAQGKTILVASHQLDEIELICNRIALLDNGRLLVVGRPSEIKDSLRGVLHKYRVHVSSPLGDVDGGRSNVWFLGDCNIVIADRDLTESLGRRFGDDAVEQVEPTLEEVFLWLLNDRREDKESRCNSQASRGGE